MSNPLCAEFVLWHPELAQLVTVPAKARELKEGVGFGQLIPAVVASVISSAFLWSWAALSALLLVQLTK